VTLGPVEAVATVNITNVLITSMSVFNLRFPLIYDLIDTPISQNKKIAMYASIFVS
jgi:hypothetical protein